MTNFFAAFLPQTRLLLATTVTLVRKTDDRDPRLSRGMSKTLFHHKGRYQLIKRSVSAFRVACTVASAAAGLTLFSSVAAAATYYVSPAGSDANNGVSPNTAWQTVARVNASAFQPGDQVLFQRGGQWHESLIASSSGTQTSPITFGDYGSGAKPKFWGSVVLTNSQFQAIGNGLYVYSIASPVYSVLANQAFFNYSFGQPASNISGSWSYANGQIMLSSPSSDPRFDGRVYSAVERDDVVYTNGQSHLVFNNLVVDESARYDDNGGYGFRVMNSQDVQLTNCEAYHAGKHHFGVINSTRFVGTNLVAAYAAPGQQSSGGASAYVTYGDTSTGLLSQTSEWHNISAANMDDPQDNTVYQSFLNHGATVTSVWLDGLKSYGAGTVLSNTDHPGAVAKMTGGLIQNARLEIDGSGAWVDGVELSGAQATIDVAASNTVLQNLLIHGTNLGSEWYQTAVLARGTNNLLRFSTIVMDPAAGSNSCIALLSAGANFQMYGNILLAPHRVFALWDEGLNLGTFTFAGFNFYTPGSTFAQFVGGAFQWVDTAFGQWQANGEDVGSLQGDPRFTDAANGNYRPLAGSPVIDAVPLVPSTLTTIPTDLAGNVRLQGAAYDMGAYESTGSVATVVAAATTTNLSLSNGTLMALVSATSGIPTGTISFYDGSNLLGTAQLSSGSASLAVSLTTTDAHVLTATFAGTANFAGSTSQAVSVAAVVVPVTTPPVTTPPVTTPPVTTPPVTTPVTTTPAQAYPILLTFPANLQTVSGTITATAAIGQTLDAAGSHLLVDGQFLDDHRVTSAPYVYSVDTTQLTVGAHTLQLWAHDISNTTLLSNTVTILVTR